MDLTMPRLNYCVKNLLDLKASNPWICPVNNCLSINNSPENKSHFFCQNGFGTTLVGPVWTSHHFRILKSGSVAGSRHVLRARVSIHHLFEPNFGVHVPRSFGKTVIVFTSHLDLTWDKRSRLKVLSTGSFPVFPSLGGVSTSKYGVLTLESHALHATG
ncbi:hypothetical protein TNCV_2135481 [Trichonephila clavipes]|nr:hypothetical protein TNCV_2135481 [Trichonephila clavipes]